MAVLLIWVLFQCFDWRVADHFEHFDRVPDRLDIKDVVPEDLKASLCDSGAFDDDMGSVFVVAHFAQPAAAVQRWVDYLPLIT